MLVDASRTNTQESNLLYRNELYCVILKWVELPTSPGCLDMAWNRLNASKLSGDCPVILWNESFKYNLQGNKALHYIAFMPKYTILWHLEVVYMLPN